MMKIRQGNKSKGQESYVILLSQLVPAAQLRGLCPPNPPRLAAGCSPRCSLPITNLRLSGGDPHTPLVLLSGHMGRGEKSKGQDTFVIYLSRPKPAALLRGALPPKPPTLNSGLLASVLPPGCKPMAQWGDPHTPQFYCQDNFISKNSGSCKINYNYD